MNDHNLLYRCDMTVHKCIQWCCCIDVVLIKYFTLSCMCMLSFIKFLQLAFVSGVVFSVIAGWFTYVFTVLDSCPYLYPVYIIANHSLQIEMLLFVIWCNLLPHMVKLDYMVLHGSTDVLLDPMVLHGSTDVLLDPYLLHLPLCH